MGRILDLSDDDIEGAATQIADRMQAPVIVADPDPAWTARFEAAREELARGLGSQARSIHHIGSTSVPGLPAKPLVDIMVEVEDLAAVRAWVGDLAALGYRFADHPQNTDRLFFSRADNGTNINLHFVATSSNELGRHLRFRDRLRTDDALRDRYAALKRRLAEAYPHQRWLYTESKSAFIQQIEGSD